MRYEEFRAEFMAALGESRLEMIGLHPQEAIDLRSTNRTFKVHVEPIGGSDAEPFHVSAAISWGWDALNTARAATKEEDMLTELLGREAASDFVTDQPRLRVDVELRASLPWGRPLKMPSRAAWASWAREVIGRLEDIEPLTPAEHTREDEYGRVEILAWQGPPKAKVSCSTTGELELEAVSIEAMQIMQVPRTFDLGVEPDEGPEEPLTEMFRRIRASLVAWMQAVTNLTKT
jgi:hypothetical protein